MDTYSVFCDFDGTITVKDTTDEILRAFADKEWESVENEWLSGAFGSEECLRRQMKLVKATENELIALLDTIEIDPFFLQFVSFCKKKNISVTVVSDGFDYIINYILNKHQLGHLPHYANTLLFEDGSLNTRFSNSRPDCDLCATCKVGVVNRVKQDSEKVIVIGDGYSDKYITQCADYLFAKEKLRDVCEQSGIAYYLFGTFQDVIIKMEECIVSNDGSDKSVCGLESKVFDKCIALRTGVLK